MDKVELLKKVRKIELKTRGLSSQVFSGDYHSAFKGRGMAFSEVREYQPGDEVRTIDWNVTARFNHPYVKKFEEERELTVMVLVDVSRSGDFGTHAQLKQELVTEISAVLSFSAIMNNDKAGILFFSDIVEKFIPPKKGRAHILRIIQESLEHKPTGKGTSISSALEYISNAIKNRCIVFVISDFLSGEFEDSLRIANRRHDVIGLHVYDRRELELPDIGLVQMFDNETGGTIWVNTSDPNVRLNYAREARAHRLGLEEMFKRTGIDSAHIATGDKYIKTLSTLFRKREKRRK
ncbi:MAG TPA: DUF58 domain-containing protein [Bacteroidia bacterium]|jgi:uncharacterized protein (DUF58 family)|nr:DUF58 domain-containing protein [Bacteroidia bacterium]